MNNVLTAPQSSYKLQKRSLKRPKVCSTLREAEPFLSTQNALPYANPAQARALLDLIAHASDCAALSSFEGHATA